MELITGFVEIGQDAAAVIETGRPDIGGVFTGGIQTCMVTAFECQDALVVVHDSAQLVFSDISALVGRYGRCRRLTAIYPRSSYNIHMERLDRLKRIVGASGNRFQKMPVDSNGFALSFSVAGELEIFSHGSIAAAVPLPEKPIRTSITELNNFFITPGSQSLKLDIQFSEGKYNPVRELDKTLAQILKLVELQPKFFFNNAALLYAAHQLHILDLPAAMVDVVERHKLQRFRTEVVQPHQLAQQESVFEEYLSA